MFKKYVVTLTEDEREQLRALVSGGKSAARKLNHARILLLADASQGPARTDQEIVEALGLGGRTVERVRQRFVEEGFEAALDPKPQPRRAGKLEGQVEAHVIALAKSDPPKGRKRWTLRLLADEMVQLQYIETISHESVRQALKKNGVKPWQEKTWCIPPQADDAFVYRMEAILELYRQPYDPRYPVVCMDEACKQLIGETRIPLPLGEGRPLCSDYEYVRNGVCNQFMFCEPLRGWRKVFVRARRTKIEWAHCLREILDGHYPDAIQVQLVLDNLNTHTGASLYAAFPPAEARRLLERVAFHYTPKHGSWLNMAEIEIGVMNGQCLNRRLDDRQIVRDEVAAWEQQRNQNETKVNWTFTVSDARVKLHRIYPSIEA